MIILITLWSIMTVVVVAHFYLTDNFWFQKSDPILMGACILPMVFMIAFFVWPFALLLFFLKKFKK